MEQEYFWVNPTEFSSLPLQDALLANLGSLGYHVMTPIQARSLPPMLAGQDVIGQGKTGSGKTAAFGLVLLHHLNVKLFQVQSLVLCPTRELADQVAKEIRRLARGIHNIKILTLCGGAPFGPQLGSLEHGAHIIVGTPGRIEEHLRKGSLHLGQLQTLVLDEADRMLDMGFQPSLDAIMEYVPGKRQTLLFSATFPDQIKSIAERIMTAPVLVQAASSHDQNTIAQHFYQVDDNQQRLDAQRLDAQRLDAQRLDALRLLLLHQRPQSALVFCNTRQETSELAEALRTHGFSALALHGELEQKDRDQTLVRFANKSVSVLVATDVAARGLDIDALDAVINYHLARETEVHVHRIGRTGRAGSRGTASTLYSAKESHKIARLEAYLDITINAEPLPPAAILATPPYQPPMVTLQIDGGKKQKVRAGDILGALTGQDGIDGNSVGKIDLFDNWAFVAVARAAKQTALQKISQGKLKGRSFRVRQLGR